MRSTETRIGVGGGLHTAVTVHRPDDVVEDPVVAFCLPGGGYARGYYDIRHDDDAYSQAAYHTARGWVVVACDHLGVGDSDQPDDAGLTVEALADADAATVRGVLAQLGVRPRLVLGIGQSMGGCFTVVAQARHRIYDAIAVLGYSAIAGTLPTPPASGPKVDPMRYVMHSDDADAGLVDADVGHGYPVRATLPPWASATMPSVARTLLRPGLLSAYSREVDVPVFIGCGERDMVPTPRAEPSYYSASSDITLTVIPRMAHMHNFARTREMLWSRLHNWGEGIASVPSPT